MRKYNAALVAGSAVVLSLLVGGAFGPTPNRPRTAFWYLLLRKPRFTPAGWQIGAAWSVLDVLLITSGYRLLVAPPTPNRKTALTGWFASVSGIAIQPWIFFGHRQLKGSLAIIAAIFTSSIATVMAATKIDRLAAIASLPLVAWSLFAGLLNEELIQRN